MTDDGSEEHCIQARRVDCTIPAKHMTIPNQGHCTTSNNQGLIYVKEGMDEVNSDDASPKFAKSNPSMIQSHVLVNLPTELALCIGYRQKKTKTHEQIQQTTNGEEEQIT